mgnify:CR=1 FL=1
MRTDNEILHDGYKTLFRYMDIVEAEKFITLINRNRLDYTKWRENLFEDMSIEEIIQEGKKFAVDFRKIKGKL